MDKKKTDRNFDDLIGHFKKNIYDTPKGRIRLEILWRDLTQVLPQLLENKPLRILDAGSGLGYMAGKLASQGHELVLCDISAEILDEAQKQLAKNHPKATYQLVNAAVQELQEYVNGQFDLILFHAVLEWLAEPQATLSEVCKFVKPAGHLSLMFYNKHGLIYRHLLNANFKVLLDGEPRVGDRLVPECPLVPDEVAQWLLSEGMEIQSRTGVRVIYDYLDQQQKQRMEMQELMEMELRYSHIKPYADLARYQHFIACKS
jgi:S-adenosylmethionine-dependent methyltransferase